MEVQQNTDGDTPSSLKPVTIRKLFLVFSREATIVKKKHQRQKNNFLLYSKIMKLLKYFSCCNLFFSTVFCIFIGSIYLSEDMPCNDFGHVDCSLTYNQPKTFSI